MSYKHVKQDGEYVTKIDATTSDKDAFGRMRVSEINTIFDTKFLYDKLPLLWDEALEGGASAAEFDSNNACISLAAYANGERVIRQSKYRFNYKSGKSQQYMFTGVLGEAITGLKRQIGCFDDDNGLFFELDGNILSVVIRKNGEDTKINQSNWNTDKLDGTSVSNHTLDVSKTQLFIIDYQWLGVGTVRFGFAIDGEILYCHQEHHANIDTTVYTATPNFPIRYEISSTGGSGELIQICSNVGSEGGVDRWLHRFVYTNDKVDCNTVGTTYSLLGLKLKDTHLSSTIVIDTISVLAMSNDNFQWHLLLNPTVSGVMTYTDETNSYLEIGRTAGGNPSAEVVTNMGTIIDGGFGSSQVRTAIGDINSMYGLGSTISGISDTLVLAVTPFTANADIRGGITWKEMV